MYCKTCGEVINDEAVICPKCGCETGKKSHTEKDGEGIGFFILGFLFPLIGLILYLVWKNEYPLRAKSVGKGALISVITVAVLYFLILIFAFAAFGTVATYSY